jgi:helix-turn-helix protein
MTTEAVSTSQLARAAHRVLEPVHTLVYFVPEAAARYEQAGVTGGMRGYFASRSAPLGKVPAEVVISTFYNFAPSHVRKAIPAVWENSSPEAMVAARFDVADAALRRLLGEACDSDEMARAAELARTALTAATIVGRPLFAAHAALPWPEPAHLQLWHAATLLREHRGDGHIAALVLAGLSGPEAVVSYVATGGSMPEDLMRATRGYTEQEWAETKQRLRERGIFGDGDTFTAAGREQRDEIEARTDDAAVAPYEHLGEERTRELTELVRPWARSITKQIFG